MKTKLGCCGTIFMILLILVILVMGIIVYGYSTVLDQIERPDPTEATLSQEEIDAIENETDAPEDLPEEKALEQIDEVTMPDKDAEVIEQADHIINILLIGQDRLPGQGRQRSDSMILCTINTQKKTLVMTSFLRDLYVDIPSWNGRTYQDNRLNVCYAFGGMGMLDEALKKNFGVVVDHNIEVDFSGFQEIIEIFGGVRIDLTRAEADYLGGGLKEGANFLTPEQALSYARIRKLDSDFGRTNRQRKLLTSLLNAVKDMSYDQMANLVNKILPMLTTDMTNSEITNYMVQLLPILSQLEITTQSIPAAGTYRNANVRGMAVLVPDLEANIAILRQTLS